MPISSACRRHWPARKALAAAVLMVVALAHAIPPQMQTRVQQLPPQQRAQVQRQLEAWKRWTPAAQQAFRERLAQWEAQPPAERARARERYAAWQALDGRDRALLQEARAYHARLPAQEQEALRARFEEQDANLRHGWLLGPRVGADYAALRPLLFQVPPEQREPLLAVLRAMSADERADLAVLAQRTPPQERDELRRALLSTSDANRATWLRLRMEQ